ncbi:KEOPS complex subunit Pcc1 [Methanobrevibacter sp.]|uniref:KEOPS complex subunit Pcc1 n=1 Tax=Methanobrevibacter sp. TaxID=66852 RepID=UPI003890653B
MKIKGKIIFTYDDEKDAEVVFDSLEIDNEGYLESKLSKNKIEYCLSNENIGSFLNTSDDLVASEIVVEKILKTQKN